MAEAQIVAVSRLLDERGLSAFQIKLIVWSLFIVFIDGSGWELGIGRLGSIVGPLLMRANQGAAPAASPRTG